MDAPEFLTSEFLLNSSLSCEPSAPIATDENTTLPAGSPKSWSGESHSSDNKKDSRWRKDTEADHSSETSTCKGGKRSSLSYDTAKENVKCFSWSCSDVTIEAIRKIHSEVTMRALKRSDSWSSSIVQVTKSDKQIGYDGLSGILNHSYCSNRTIDTSISWLTDIPPSSDSGLSTIYSSSTVSLDDYYSGIKEELPRNTYSFSDFLHLIDTNFLMAHKNESERPSIISDHLVVKNTKQRLIPEASRQNSSMNFTDAIFLTLRSSPKKSRRLAYMNCTKDTDTEIHIVNENGNITCCINDSKADFNQVHNNPIDIIKVMKESYSSSDLSFQYSKEFSQCLLKPRQSHSSKLKPHRSHSSILPCSNHCCSNQSRTGSECSEAHIIRPSLVESDEACKQELLNFLFPQEASCASEERLHFPESSYSVTHPANFMKSSTSLKDNVVSHSSCNKAENSVPADGMDFEGTGGCFAHSHKVILSITDLKDEDSIDADEKSDVSSFPLSVTDIIWSPMSAQDLLVSSCSQANDLLNTSTTSSCYEFCAISANKVTDSTKCRKYAPSNNITNGEERSIEDSSEKLEGVVFEDVLLTDEDDDQESYSTHSQRKINARQGKMKTAKKKLYSLLKSCMCMKSHDE